jgi:hypothetical protein
MIVRYYLNDTVVTEPSDKDDIQKETAPGVWESCKLRPEPPAETGIPKGTAATPRSIHETPPARIQSPSTERK